MAIGRILTFSFYDFIRNFWLSVVIVTVFVLALVSFTLLSAFQYISDSAVDQIQSRIDVGVYFHVDTSQSQMDSIKSYIESLSTVKDVRIINAEEALIQFKEKHQNEPEIIAALDELGENPLGSSLLISAFDVNDYPAILESLDDAPHQDVILDKDFDDHDVVLSRLAWAKSRIQIIITAIAIFFLFVSALVIFNTIRIAIYSKREEIGIMKLVGANNSFVRVPFILTSVLYAIIAFLIALFLIFPLLAVINPYLVNFFENASFDLLQYFIDNFVGIFGTQLLAVIVIAMLSSAIAVSRYLNV